MTHSHPSRISEVAHDVSRPHSHHHVPFIGVFVALVVLTIVTVGVALHRFDAEIVNLLLALAVASIKGALVAMYFMHLKFEGKLIYIIFFVPLGLCVLLVVALIPDIVMTDPAGHSASLHLFNPIKFVNSGSGHH